MFSFCLRRGVDFQTLLKNAQQALKKGEFEKAAFLAVHCRDQDASNSIERKQAEGLLGSMMSEYPQMRLYVEKLNTAKKTSSSNEISKHLGPLI